MAGGVKLTGARGKGPTAHGSKNQKHRANEGERANTSMPRNWPEGKAGARGGRSHDARRGRGRRLRVTRAAVAGGRGRH